MKILIVKTSSLGDIIHTFPVLSFLRKRFPDATIDWVVEEPFAPLVDSLSAVNHVIPVETKKWRKRPFSSWPEIKIFCRNLRSTVYDVVFDLQGNIKSAVILSCVKAQKKVGFGWKTAAEKPNCFFTNTRFDPPTDLPVRQENLFIVQSFFQDHNPFQEDPTILNLNADEEQFLGEFRGPKILVCPGSAWPNKQVTREALVHFLENLSIGSFSFAWGNEKEYDEAAFLAQHFPGSLLLPKLSLPLLQNLMKQMDLVIAMDSLPLHLAATAGVPTFGIFGPSSAAKYNPSGKLHVAYQGSCPYGRLFNRRCPVLRSCPTGLCTRGITGDELFHSFKKQDLL